MLTCQMSVGEANVAVMKNAWRNSWYMTWRRKMEDIVRLPSYQCIYGGRSEERDHADTSEDAEASGIRPFAGLYMIGERLMVGCDWFEGFVMRMVPCV